MTRTIRYAQGLVPVLALLSLTAGCFTVDITAPYGPDVRVLPPDEPVEVTRRYQKWFALWGIFPISANDPKSIIAEEQLVEARVSTADSIEDVLSGIAYFFMFPIGIMVPQTIVVEGNRMPLNERALPLPESIEDET